MSHYKNFSFLLILAIVLTGCLKDSIIPKTFAPIEVNTGLPLIDSKMTISNAVQADDDSYHLSINSEGYYSFIFTPNKQEFPTAETFIALKDIQLFKVPATRPYITIPGNKIEPYPKSNNLGLPFVVSFSGVGNDQLAGAKLKKITYKGGQISLSMDTDYPTGVTVEANFISLTKNGQPLKMIFDLDVSNFGTGDVTRTASLDGYTLDLSSGDTSSNRFRFDLNIINFAFPNGSSAYPDHLITVTGLSFQDQKWSKIKGKFGAVEFPITSNTDPLNFATNIITLLPFTNNNNQDEDSTQIEFVFTNPSMHGTLFNGFGLPAALSLKPINAIGIKGNRSLNSDSSGNEFLVNPLNSDLFTISGPQFGNLFEKGPQKLKYSMFMNIKSTDTSDFMLDTSRIATDLVVDLPLYGTFQLFNLKSIAKNPLYQNTDSIPLFDPKEAEVRFAYENTMPLGFTLQVYFIKEDGKTRIDSLFEKDVNHPEIEYRYNAEAATVGSDGFSNSVKNTYTNPQLVPMTPAKFIRIKTAPKLLYSAKMNSTDITHLKPAVKIRPSDYINIRMSAGVVGTVDLNKATSTSK